MNYRLIVNLTVKAGPGPFPFPCPSCITQYWGVARGRLFNRVRNGPIEWVPFVMIWYSVLNKVRNAVCFSKFSQVVTMDYPPYLGWVFGVILEFG